MMDHRALFRKLCFMRDSHDFSGEKVNQRSVLKGEDTRQGQRPARRWKTVRCAEIARLLFDYNVVMKKGFAHAGSAGAAHHIFIARNSFRNTAAGGEQLFHGFRQWSRIRSKKEK
jgi:hypothetical protein